MRKRKIGAADEAKGEGEDGEENGRFQRREAHIEAGCEIWPG